MTKKQLKAKAIKYWKDRLRGYSVADQNKDIAMYEDDDAEKLLHICKQQDIVRDLLSDHHGCTSKFGHSNCDSGRSDRS